MAVNNCHMLQYRADKGLTTEQSPDISQPRMVVPPPQKEPPAESNPGSSPTPAGFQPGTLLSQKLQKFGGAIQSKIHPALVTVSHGTSHVYSWLPPGVNCALLRNV